MRPGYRSPSRRHRRPWWRRCLAALWRVLPRTGPPRDDVVLVLALLCGLLAVVWALSVLAP